MCTVILESFVRFLFSQWAEGLKRFRQGFILKARQKYQVVINTYINTIRFFVRVSYLCCEIIRPKPVASLSILAQQIFNPLNLVLSSLFLIRPIPNSVSKSSYNQGAPPSRHSRTHLEPTLIDD